jgi:hypothetical protein
LPLSTLSSNVLFVKSSAGLLVTLATWLGCTGPEWDGDPSSCSFVQDGACVRLEPGTRAAPKDLQFALGVAAAYWSADASVLSGYLISVHPQNADLSLCGGGPWTTSGCVDRARAHMHLRQVDDCAFLYLPHEVGHVALDGDGDHEDPRWPGVAHVKACD